jgi:arylsulfatase
MMSGKWHIGERDPSGRTLPSVFGFSRDYTLLRGADNHYGSIRDATYSDDGRVHRLEDATNSSVYSTIRYTDKLLSFLSDHDGSTDPFFAVYAPTAPHWPLHYPPGWEERFTGVFDGGFDALCSERMAGALNENILPANVSTASCNKETGPWNALSTEEQQSFIKAMEIYAAMVAHLDEEIGRILETLEQQDKMDNTWIIFMNDNGPQGGALLARMIGGRDTSPYNNSLANLGKPDSWASVGQGWADASSSPYRSTKGFPYEGGIRVPAFIWHGNAVTSGNIDNQFLTVMDIMPTVLDIADIDAPQGNFKGRDILPIRGKSMVPLLSSDQGRVHMADEAIALDHSGHRMMVKGDWKIVQQARQGWQLFNMIEDPMESRDLSSQRPNLFADMMAEFNGFAATRNYIEVNAAINQP